MTGRPWIPPPSTLVLLLMAGAVAFFAVQPDNGPAAAKTRPSSGSAITSDAADETTSLPAFMAQPFDETMLTRPIFAPTRRQVEPKPAPEPVPLPAASVVAAKPTPAPLPPPDPPDLALKGTLRDGDTRTALIELPGIQPRWVRIDDAVDEWRVLEIGPAHVLLGHEALRHRVGLHD